MHRQRAMMAKVVPGNANAFPARLGVLACEHVAAGAAPVLLVVRDEDDCWQFLCGEAHEDDQCRDLAVGQLLGGDPSLAETSRLAIGAFAERDAAGAAWQFGLLDG